MNKYLYLLQFQGSINEPRWQYEFHAMANTDAVARAKAIVEASPLALHGTFTLWTGDAWETHVATFEAKVVVTRAR